MSTQPNQCLFTDCPENEAVGRRSRSKITLERHLQRIDVFKIGLQNSFGIDFRTARRKAADDPSSSALFYFLGEILPLIRPRSAQFETTLRRAYATLEQEAEESFWKVYADFQPMVHSIAESSGIEADEMDAVLGRAILLFDASRGTKFVTYLEKTTRENIKNLRGKRYSEELGIPVSAGRLVTQMLWLLDQQSMRLGRSLTREESESVITDFLKSHRTKLGTSTMHRVAKAIVGYRAAVSMDAARELLEPSAGESFSRHRNFGNDNYVDQADERDQQMSDLMNVIRVARFNPDEVCLLLERLDLPHDERRHLRIASTVTGSSLRKRKQRLLVRMLAAKFASRAPRFGSLVNQSACKSRSTIRAGLEELASDRSSDSASLIADLTNWMSLSESVYRISINERRRLEDYLADPHPATLATGLFQKLVAALIEQERLGFPCMGSETGF